MIIALTGENCAGKGTVAEYLMKKGFHYHSLSDVVRDELKSDGRKVTRESLIEKANQLREGFGPEILAKKILMKLENDRNYVIDSVRNPEEARELVKANAILIYITADAKIRFERMKSRKRENDPETYEEFLKLEKAELHNKDSSKQNLAKTFEFAGKKLVNNGDFQELHAQVDSLLSKISVEFSAERPSWDEYFMSIAKVVASRSNCMKRKVAAIIVKDKRIISTGYNGTPRGVKNCNEGGCARCNSFGESGKNLSECVCSHAEENAIVQASYHGISIKESTLYNTFCPCLLCTKMIINAGIKEVVYNAEYPMGDLSLKLLKETGIKVRQYQF